MDALRNFLGGIGFLFAAAIIFSAMRGTNFGSTADWAGAAANVAVVTVTLWLTFSERRRISDAVKAKTTATQRAFRASLAVSIGLGDLVANSFFGQTWPDEWLRDEIKLRLQAINTGYRQFDSTLLPDAERIEANIAEHIQAQLSQTISLATAANDAPILVTSLDWQTILESSADRLRTILANLPDI